jgi:hypothetical protein
MWRDLIIATPQAWAILPHINGFTSPRWTRLCLERSKNADLDIALSDPGDHNRAQRNLQCTLDMIIPRLDQCGTLSILFRTRPLASFFPLPKPMSRLQSLGLICPQFTLPHGVSLVDETSECTLRVLVIWALHLPTSLFEHLNTRFITDLHLTSIAGIPHHVLDIINNSSSIQKLFLGEERCPSEFAPEPVAVHTPHLVTLCFSGCTLVQHLKAWTAPQLLELTLSSRSRPFCFGPEDTFHFPALQALSVASVDANDENLHILYKILHSHPSLTNLHIPCDASLYNVVFRPLLISPLLPNLRTLYLVARSHGYTDALNHLRHLLDRRPDIRVILVNGGKIPKQFWPGRAAAHLESDFPARVSIKV